MTSEANVSPLPWDNTQYNLLPQNLVSCVDCLLIRKFSIVLYVDSHYICVADFV